LWCRMVLRRQSCPSRLECEGRCSDVSRGHLHLAVLGGARSEPLSSWRVRPRRFPGPDQQEVEELGRCPAFLPRGSSRHPGRPSLRQTPCFNRRVAPWCAEHAASCPVDRSCQPATLRTEEPGRSQFDLCLPWRISAIDTGRFDGRDSRPGHGI
jgi:hypothetical protein